MLRYQCNHAAGAEVRESTKIREFSLSAGLGIIRTLARKSYCHDSGSSLLLLPRCVTVFK